MQSVYTVQPDERGVELRFGKPKDEISQPGLHMIFWPFETVEMASIVEREMSTGGSSRTGSIDGLMLSGDQNIVDVEFKLLYSVQIRQRSCSIWPVRKTRCARLRKAPCAKWSAADRPRIFSGTTVRPSPRKSRQFIQTGMDAFPSGIVVNQVSIEDAAPPREVADAFDEVQRAEQDEDRFVEEANQYANQKLGQARGEGAQLREEASAYKDRVVNEATGEAGRFISVYEEYAKAPEVTRSRLYLETLERVLGGSDKVIIEQNGGGAGRRALSAPAGSPQEHVQEAQTNG
jgi:membrane protease subunit HflK